jgi:hypothetical protein
MVCPPIKGCGGAGTKMVNDMVVDCSRCGGKGEDTRTQTFNPPRDENAPQTKRPLFVFDYRT